VGACVDGGEDGAVRVEACADICDCYAGFCRAGVCAAGDVEEACFREGYGVVASALVGGAVGAVTRDGGVYEGWVYLF